MSQPVQQLLDAAKVYDRTTATQAADAIAAGAADIEFNLAKKAMQGVRNHRWFDLLERIGAAFVARPDVTPAVQKLYAQSLIELGKLDAARDFLGRMIDTCKSNEYEYNESRGLLGRAYKQAYVNGAGDEWLDAAIRQYATVYRENPEENFWHGINAVALLALARRRNIAVSVQADERAMARAIRQRIDDLAADNREETWDYATAAEASVALDDWAGAGEWMRLYLDRAENDAFAIASTLRQFEEVWELDEVQSAEAAGLIYMLKAGLFAKHGGGTITVPASAPTDDERQYLQKVHGAEHYIPAEVLETGIARARNVARIGWSSGTGDGTGFFVPAKQLDPRLGDGWLLVTCAHVVPDAVPWQSAVVVFLAAQPRKKRKYRVAEMVWTSPVGQLDASILRLEVDSVDEITEPYPIIMDLPPVHEDARIYIVGHPKGGELQFSISDNVLLDAEAPKMHYRTPTDEGSSGSPAFYGDEWELVALHHSGRKEMPRLKGQPGVYEANEGIFIGSIVRAFRERG
ncbi:MAG TPA: serine protease [Thermoanaerobaculia bacterium]|nr:serine protease [Thermoanaerobaculia bacterium]